MSNSFFFCMYDSRSFLLIFPVLSVFRYKESENLNKVREEIVDGWLHVTSRTEQEATRMSQSYNNNRTLAHVQI